MSCVQLMLNCDIETKGFNETMESIILDVSTIDKMEKTRRLGYAKVGQVIVQAAHCYIP